MHNLSLYSRVVFATVLFIAVLSTVPVSLAAPAGNLFAAEVPVSERTSEAKEEATQRALAEVLVKVSGSLSIASEANANLILEDAGSYVQQFRYTSNGTLLVGFDGRKLQSEMRAAGLPVWGADRPSTLVWLAVDYGDGDRRILGADDQGEIRNEIEGHAAARGVPLVWPLNDSTDRATVEATDVWGGFTENITVASRRYGTEGVLVARVSQGPDGPMYGTWDLNIEGDATNWSGNFGDSINRLADFYAERLSVASSSGPATRVAMSIDGLTSAKAYADAISAIEKLSVVESVQVAQVSNQRVVLDLTLRGDTTQVSRALGLSRLFEAETDADNSATLAYRYTR
ncbi:MAG: DUF2066 domain-containing protein [Gammaproteobacteria bacterium]